MKILLFLMLTGCMEMPYECTKYTSYLFECQVNGKSCFVFDETINYSIICESNH